MHTKEAKRAKGEVLERLDAGARRVELTLEAHERDEA
jgi:hypothetical protein